MPTRTHKILIVAIALAGLLGSSSAGAADHQIGLGIRYWEVLDQIQDDFNTVNDGGESYVFAYQVWPSQYFRWEFDLEFADQGVQGSTLR